MKLELCMPTRVVFGRGSIDRLGELAAPLGSRVMVVRGGRHLDRSGALDSVRGQLASIGMHVIEHAVVGEPDVTAVDEAADLARQHACDLVIGIGGGAALDAAKAVAGLLTLGGRALDYLEVVGRGIPIDHPSAPLIAIPTTAGTGTEVTRNAVLTHKPSRFKASMRSPYLLPRIALVDPALTDSVPPQVTAATGLDALTQLIEPYVSTGANPLTDGLALEGVALVAKSLACAWTDGADEAARDDMSLASLMGGICLANAGLGAVHGFAAPLGAMYPVAHGAACAALLHPVMKANVQALRETDARHPTLARFARVGEALTARRYEAQDDAIDAGVAFVRDLVRALEVPGLSSRGLGPADVDAVVSAARKASSMRYNPVVLSDHALASCLREAL
jgi:alcohol dehydrogenase class IV